ncbi:MAG: DUF2953 domain-containing protein [Ruminococcus sp.]|nr:DUF2953 domain-containing protein [Ruminococcus sp.]
MIYVLTAIAVLLILIGILLFVNVSLKVKYDDKENVFRVALCYLWFTYVLAPEEETKKYKKALNKKGEAQKTEKKEKKKSSIKEKGIATFLEDLKSIVKSVWTLLVCVLRRAVLKTLLIKLSVAGEDAADTAIVYGYANAVIFPIVSAFTENVKEYKELDVSITPDFSEDAQAVIQFELELKIKPAKLLGAVIECRESAADLLSALGNKKDK